MARSAHHFSFSRAVSFWGHWAVRRRFLENQGTGPQGDRGVTLEFEERERKE